MPTVPSVNEWSQVEEIAVSPKTYRILVADDDVSVVRLFCENLQEMGYAVDTAYDGQMALQQAKLQRPDLIILDVNMPMTSGLKVFEYLRASPETAATPIIFVTGDASSAVYPAIADAPRVAHLKKPVDLEGLNSLVRLFLQRYAA